MMAQHRWFSAISRGWWSKDIQQKTSTENLQCYRHDLLHKIPTIEWRSLSNALACYHITSLHRRNEINQIQRQSSRFDWGTWSGVSYFSLQLLTLFFNFQPYRSQTSLVDFTQSTYFTAIPPNCIGASAALYNWKIFVLWPIWRKSVKLRFKLHEQFHSLYWIIPRQKYPHVAKCVSVHQFWYKVHK